MTLNNTYLVNLKDFRKNLTKYTGQIKIKEARLIVLKHGRPIMEIRHINSNADLRSVITEKQPPHLYTLREALELLSYTDE